MVIIVILTGGIKMAAQDLEQMLREFYQILEDKWKERQKNKEERQKEIAKLRRDFVNNEGEKVDQELTGEVQQILEERAKQRNPEQLDKIKNISVEFKRLDKGKVIVCFPNGKEMEIPENALSKKLVDRIHSLEKFKGLSDNQLYKNWEKHIGRYSKNLQKEGEGLDSTKDASLERFNKTLAQGKVVNQWIGQQKEELQQKYQALNNYRALANVALEKGDITHDEWFQISKTLDSQRNVLDNMNKNLNDISSSMTQELKIQAKDIAPDMKLDRMKNLDDMIQVGEAVAASPEKDWESVKTYAKENKHQEASKVMEKIEITETIEVTEITETRFG